MNFKSFKAQKNEKVDSEAKKKVGKGEILTDQWSSLVYKKKNLTETRSENVVK